MAKTKYFGKKSMLASGKEEFIHIAGSVYINPDIPDGLAVWARRYDNKTVILLHMPPPNKADSVMTSETERKR